MFTSIDIKRFLKTIFLILLLSTVFNFVYTSDATAGILGDVVQDARSAWDKITEATNAVLQDISDFVNDIKDKLKWIANPCQQTIVDKIYGFGCHTCMIMKVMMSAFINGCSVLEEVSQEAGKKILLICSFMWLVFFVLQQLSSLKNIEPMSMLNTIIVMLFKILCTYLVIDFGFILFLNYLAVPLLKWGVDFGNVMLDAAIKDVGLNNSQTAPGNSSFMLDAQGFLPASLVNSMMNYVAKINGVVSNHLKLGHMVTCHARFAGAWATVGFDGLLGIHLTNIGTWLSGISIWILAFIIAFSVMFYLLDVTFKLAIAMVFLPILVAFWPFGFMRDKCLVCANMVLNAAGLFVFLSLTASIGLVLVDKGVQIGELARLGLDDDTILQPEASGTGISLLMSDISDGNAEAVANRFLFTTPFFMLIFCYLYAIKLIRSTIGDYVNTFFPDNIGGKMQTIHHHMTGAASYLKQKGANIAKSAGKKMEVSKKAATIGKAAVGGVGGVLAAAALKAGVKAIGNTINNARNSNNSNNNNP